jgi:hypothetical protein
LGMFQTKTLIQLFIRKPIFLTVRLERILSLDSSRL